MNCFALPFSGIVERYRNDPVGAPARRDRLASARIQPEARTDRASRSLGSREVDGAGALRRQSGDFDLTPPTRLRPDKTDCDRAGVTERGEALRLLRAGVGKGLVSEQVRGRFPQNIWAVTVDGYPLEAQLENFQTGTYHGYPMPETDPFRASDAVVSLPISLM